MIMGSIVATRLIFYYCAFPALERPGYCQLPLPRHRGTYFSKDISGFRAKKYSTDYFSGAEKG
jgi:hypothetical protein